MAGYSIRPLAELSKRARGYFTGAIEGTIASVFANTFVVIAKVMGNLDFEHELRRKWLFAQIFASTADEAWLARHGFELGLARTPAAFALGTVTLAATPGLAVPAGLQFTRADGVTFTTVASATAAGNSVTLPLRADAAGAIGNADAGTSLTLVDVDDAPTGLDQVGTVDAAGIAGGADVELIEAFRARVLARKRQPPQGGSAPDYETWTREALASVDRVYVDSFANDARAVWVAFTVTDQVHGIPTAGQVGIVQAYINDAVRRPVTARAYAIQLTPLPVSVTVQGLTPDTVDVRLSVADEIVATFADLGEPGRPSGDTVFSRSWLDEAVSRAVGENRHVIVVPSADIIVPAGYLPVPADVPVLYTD